MKIFRIQINSSVVTFNLLAILVALATAGLAFFTDNQEAIKGMMTPEAFFIVTTLQSVITLWLRNTNLQGKKPIEILPKEEEKK